MAAGFTSAPLVVVPEVEHCLAEMLNDVATVKVHVFHDSFALLTVENDVLPFANRTTTFHHDANGIGRPDRGMRHVWRDEKRVTFAHEMIDDSIPFPDPNLNVAFELVKIFLRIDEMEIVPRIRTDDDHHKKIAPIIKISITDWRFKEMTIFFDPLFQINWRRH